jgi:hypothetical protein
MTIDQLDAMFPERRAECERLGLNPAEGFIPNACLFSMTEAQKDILFPARHAALKHLHRRIGEVLAESEQAS